MEEEFDLLFYLEVLKRRWILILVLPIIFAITSAIISYLIASKPIYQATTTLVMGNPNGSPQQKERDDINSILASPKMAKIFEPVVKSRYVEQKVIDQLNLPLRLEELNSKIQVNSIMETDLIVINVIDENSQLAADIANTLAKNFIEVVIEIKKVDTVSVLDRADTPDEPLKVNNQRYVIVAFFVGLAISLILAALLEALDNRLKNSEDVQKTLELPVIGMIPYDSDPLFNVKPPVSEAFRTLRTNIQFLINENVKKRIMVTSTGPSEGKSLLAVNLAVSLTQTGKRVLIIDANLRKPILHKLFQINNNEGVSTALAVDSLGQGHVVQTRIQELDVFTAGPIPLNPTELLASDNMKRILSDADFFYDVVIIDSPPALAVADASILAQMVDGVIFVVGVSEANQKYALEAKDQLVKVGAKIIGVVLNKIDLNTKDYNYYYNYDESSNGIKTKPFKQHNKIRNQPKQLPI